MKHLICILFATLFSVSAFAQDNVSSLKDIMLYKDNKVVFEEVVTVPDATATQLYGKAKMLFANAFKSSKSVIQSDDPENNTIVGKGSIVKSEDKGYGGIYYYFTLQIQAKDGKYRYTISEMRVDATGLVPMKYTIEESIDRFKSKGQSDIEAAQSYYEEFTPLIEQIKEQIKITEDDNW